jgi:hypothetical protein
LQVTSNYEAQDIDAHDLQMLTRWDKSRDDLTVKICSQSC